VNIYVFQKKILNFKFLLARWFFCIFFFKLLIFFSNYFTGSQVNNVAGWGSGCGVQIGEAGGVVDMVSGRGVRIYEAVSLVAIPP
jgi:hypothetical protein